ncbi:MULTISPECIES: ATP-dependent DNA ligase [Caldimonas]|uniref:ATP-dependent DNA ligase n=1 Tax=Caldimonas TaxID=196013 RepID=UPI00038215D8|nr:ATP-dependent DNA ligase [Caldimonas manganoxidans]
MRDFAQLYAELDASTSTRDKVAALRRYFERAAAADAAWAVYFLCGGRPRQLVGTSQLKAWACERAGIDPWLFEECYQSVGDLAETIALVLPAPTRSSDLGLAQWVEQRLLPLRGAPPELQRERLRQWWDELDTPGRFLLGKLMGGGLRVGVSRLLVTRALAEHAGVPAQVMAQRLMGWASTVGAAGTPPDAARFEALVSPMIDARLQVGQPYPFFLAHPLDVPPQLMDDMLGPVSDWLVEWKYDGMRVQVVRRAGQVWIWSRGEELMTDRFPEVVQAARAWPEGTVVDGELLVWADERPAPFASLQQRIGRKHLSRRMLADAPVRLMAFDLLEWEGQDQRMQPQAVRRRRLEALAARWGPQADGPVVLSVSTLVQAADWAELARLREGSRQRGVEGLMLKQRQSRYGVGRTKAEGLWWKWKVDPMSVDAVLVYAQRGHGRRANLLTDYTFALWSRQPREPAEAEAVLEAIARREPASPGGLQLVPFAKAYSGLSDEEFRRVDAVIRRTTLERFGPVHRVRPTLVFEIGFEGIHRSARHKSGLAVRFPRMLRVRDDKAVHEADSLESLAAWL